MASMFEVLSDPASFAYMNLLNISTNDCRWIRIDISKLLSRNFASEIMVWFCQYPICVIKERDKIEIKIYRYRDIEIKFILVSLIMKKTNKVDVTFEK